VRLTDFPRVQVSALLIACLVALAFVFDGGELWHWILMVLLVFSLFIQVKRIFPYTYIAPKQVIRAQDPSQENCISLLVSNVLTPNRNSDKLLALIKEKQPDIVITLESDSWWEEQLSEIEKDYPHCVKVPQDNLYGMHLYSKLELVESKVKYLISDEIPSIHNIVRLRNGEEIKLYSLHPKPPSPTESDTSEERDAELLMVGRHIEEHDETAIVAGDLNDVAWSYTTELFQKISGLLDPRKGRGFYNTYNAKYPIFRWALDHVFHSDDFTLVALERLPSIESDHFPMFVTLCLEKSAEAVQEEPEADEEDEEVADEKMIKAGANQGDIRM
jgi:endonuclease/exonuclease/phosphatase (EEP) superfamily protein YafD